MVRQFRKMLMGMLVWSGIMLGVENNMPISYAQVTACTGVIQDLDRALTSCSEINDNWVCYGNKLADAAPLKYRFKNTRDRRPLSVLETVNTLNKKGVVVMNLLVAGQQVPITAMLFGPVKATSGAQSSPPLFTLQVDNSGGLLCDVTPPGMVVRTETGKRAVVKVNGVEIELGSTVFITVRPNGSMIFVNIEGHVTITVNGVAQLLPVGQQIDVPFAGDQPVSASAPVPSAFAASPALRWLASADGLARVHNSNTTTQACIGKLNFGETITTTNIDPGQECLYNFCANAGDTITVDMNAQTPGLNPWLDLRAPDGSLLSFNDDLGNGNPDSQICNRVLPFTSCNYTIVARTAHNRSAGAFKLGLSNQTACVPPPLRCEVVAPDGVNLRHGPGLQYERVAGLAYGTQLQPVERTSDGAWALVQVNATEQRGWVNQDPSLVECEDDSALAASQPWVAPAPRSTEEDKHAKPTPVVPILDTPTPVSPTATSQSPTATSQPPVATPTPCAKCGPFPNP